MTTLNESTSALDSRSPFAQIDKRTFVCLGLVFAALGWIYLPHISDLAVRWWKSQDYVHGFLVIPFSVYLAYHRRDSMPDLKNLKGSIWGLVVVLGAITLQCVSAYMSDPVFRPLSIIPCLLGVTLFLGGWKALGWLWPSIVFLGFMVPLPSFMASLGNLWLQRLATICSTFLLQTVGVAAVSYGNTIMLTGTELGVAEACSGLRSTVLFFAVSVGAAFLINGVPERIAVMLTAIPAAIVANVIRITATGLLYKYADAKLAEIVFHDVFGFFMLPLAAGMVWSVSKVTSNLLVVEDETAPMDFIADLDDGVVVKKRPQKRSVGEPKVAAANETPTTENKTSSRGNAGKEAIGGSSADEKNRNSEKTAPV